MISVPNYVYKSGDGKVSVGKQRVSLTDKVYMHAVHMNSHEQTDRDHFGLLDMRDSKLSPTYIRTLLQEFNYLMFGRDVQSVF